MCKHGHKIKISTLQSNSSHISMPLSPARLDVCLPQVEPMITLPQIVNYVMIHVLYTSQHATSWPAIHIVINCHQKKSWKFAIGMSWAASGDDYHSDKQFSELSLHKCSTGTFSVNCAIYTVMKGCMAVACYVPNKWRTSHIQKTII